MKCEEVQGLLVDHIFGELTAVQRKAVDGHLQACSYCVEARKEFAMALEQLGGLEVPPPEPDLIERTLSALREESENS